MWNVTHVTHVTPCFCHQVKVTLWSFSGVPVLELVLSWSTSFGFSPSLEYSIWLWSQPGVLTLVISCNHINPGVLDWVSRAFLWRDTSNLFSFLIFSTPLSLFGCHVRSPLFFPLFVCYIRSPLSFQEISWGKYHELMVWLTSFPLASFSRLALIVCSVSSSLLSQDKILTTRFSQSMPLLLHQRPKVAQMILFTLINFARCLTTMPFVISDIFYHRQAATGGGYVL